MICPPLKFFRRRPPFDNAQQEPTTTWTVYLSGEIHSDWREQIIDGVSALDLPVNFTSAVTDHEVSDRYEQWNVAFDAGYCAALGKPCITLHDADIVHPLKEVDAAAAAWAQTPDQVVKILEYLTLN